MASSGISCAAQRTRRAFGLEETSAPHACRLRVKSPVNSMTTPTSATPMPSVTSPTTTRIKPSANTPDPPRPLRCLTLPFLRTRTPPWRGRRPFFEGLGVSGDCPPFCDTTYRQPRPHVSRASRRSRTRSNDTCLRSGKRPAGPPRLAPHRHRCVGRLVVHSGSLHVRFEDEPEDSGLVSPDEPMLIPPDRPHRVEFEDGPFSFSIEFDRSRQDEADRVG